MQVEMDQSQLVKPVAVQRLCLTGYSAQYTLRRSVDAVASVDELLRLKSLMVRTSRFR